MDNKTRFKREHFIRQWSFCFRRVTYVSLLNTAIELIKKTKDTMNTLVAWDAAQW
jgi:hypothetical protein